MRLYILVVLGLLSMPYVAWAVVVVVSPAQVVQNTPDTVPTDFLFVRHDKIAITDTPTPHTTQGQ